MTQPGLSLDSPEILACLECLIPASVGSASDSGTPNVMWLSIVHRLDENHVGLSHQFFRKTAMNVTVNQRLQLLVLHPQTGHQYHVNLEHELTETEGPRFEWMRTQLEAIASQSGMIKVFRLKGLEVCRVLSIDAVPTDQEPPLSHPPKSLALHERLNAFTEQVTMAGDVDDLIARTLAALDTCFGYQHTLLLLSEARRCSGRARCMRLGWPD